MRSTNEHKIDLTFVELTEGVFSVLVKSDRYPRRKNDKYKLRHSDSKGWTLTMLTNSGGYFYTALQAETVRQAFAEARKYIIPEEIARMWSW